MLMKKGFDGIRFLFLNVLSMIKYDEIDKNITTIESNIA